MEMPVRQLSRHGGVAGFKALPATIDVSGSNRGWFSCLTIELWLNLARPRRLAAQ
jgi:hypothetical protein